MNKTRNNIRKIEKDINLQQSDYQKYTSKLNTEKKRERYYKKVLSREVEFLYKQKYINNNEFLKTLIFFSRWRIWEKCARKKDFRDFF